MDGNKEVAEETKVFTIEQYLNGIIPNSVISAEAMQGILVDAGIEAGTPMTDVTEKQRDIAMAYLYIRVASNPLISQKVTDRDGDWEHSEGSEQWSRSQLQQFLILARNLLKKWGITDTVIETIAPKWGMVGRGHCAIRRYS